MKKIRIILLAVIVAGTCALTSCSDDDPSGESIFGPSQNAQTSLDDWLKTNYVDNYNIQIKYRYEDWESDMKYALVPATYSQSIRLAKLVKYLCLEVYDKLTGSREFIGQYFPKIIFFVGCPAYNNNGTVVLGTAEGGTKITLYAVNNLTPTNVDLLNSWYFKTIHHEFTHILNQTKPFSTDFDQVTGTATGVEYVGNSCGEVYPTDAAAQADGFISRYSATSAVEDFAEMVSIYITNSASDWNKKITAGGSFGRPMLESKTDIVKAYMANEWGLDLDELRAEILSRQEQVPTMNWDTLN